MLLASTVSNFRVEKEHCTAQTVEQSHIRMEIEITHVRTRNQFDSAALLQRLIVSLIKDSTHTYVYVKES